MHADSRLAVLPVVLLGLASVVEAFYIPGWSIKSYDDDAPIPLLVNKVFSDETQLQYAYSDLPFVCPPSGRQQAGARLVSGHSISLNLGEVLRGDRIRNSDYELRMGRDQECRLLCRKDVDRRGLKRARELVARAYVTEWIVDNLPGATTFVTMDRTRRYYAAGFKLGVRDFAAADGKPRFLLHNHVTLLLRWRKAPGKGGDMGRKVIVGFEVYPKSIGATDRDAEGCPNEPHEPDGGLELRIPTNGTERRDRHPSSSYNPHPTDIDDDDYDGPLDEDDGASLLIPYTYSVYFREEDKVEWANRWDMYFFNAEASSTIHWLAILNSLAISSVLTTVVGVILARTVRSDVRGYTGKDGLEDGRLRLKSPKRPASRRQSPRTGAGAGAGGGGEKPLAGALLDQLTDVDHDADVSSDDESLEDVTGWKLLHGDVFRSPPYGGLLAPLVGSGVQLVFMAGGLLMLSCLGILNPSFRGGFVSVGIGLFIFAGVFSGYFSGRIYQTFGRQRWRQNALMTAVLFPGLSFAFVFVLNLFVWAQASSTAIPFGTIVALTLLWLFIQLPLVYAGSWYGYVRTGPWDHPTRTHVMPRRIPRSTWYGRPIASLLLAGLLPFAVVFIELFFVFRSLWQDKSGYYYVFGYLAAVGLILVLTVTEVTIVATYMQLCAEVSFISPCPLTCNQNRCTPLHSPKRH